MSSFEVSSRLINHWFAGLLLPNMPGDGDWICSRTDLSTRQRILKAGGPALRGAAVIVVEAAEDWGGHRATVTEGERLLVHLHGDHLPQTLVRPALAVIPDVLDHVPSQVLLV